VCGLHSSISVFYQGFALHTLFMFYSVQCDELQLTSTLVKSEYSYFDPTTLSTWAGLQHWKIKPVKLKGQLLIITYLTLSTHVVWHFFLRWSTIHVPSLYVYLLSCNTIPRLTVFTCILCRKWSRKAYKSSVSCQTFYFLSVCCCSLICFC
jgi:hypothetical protein